MKIKIPGVLAMIATILVAIPVSAHHTIQAQYDTTKRAEFTGTLTKFSLVNPHVRWFFDVKGPDGKVVKWEVTAVGPKALRQGGVESSFVAGETLKVVYAPARDGSHTGRVVSFTFPDGRVVDLGTTDF